MGQGADVPSHRQFSMMVHFLHWTFLQDAVRTCLVAYSTRHWWRSSRSPSAAGAAHPLQCGQAAGAASAAARATRRSVITTG